MLYKSSFIIIGVDHLLIQSRVQSFLMKFLICPSLSSLVNSNCSVNVV